MKSDSQLHGPHSTKWAAVRSPVLAAHEVLRSTPVGLAVVWGTLLALLLEMPMALLVQALDLDMGDLHARLLEQDQATSFIEVVVVAPILETALTQALPIWVLCRWTRLSRTWIAVMCAMAFGALHSYSVAYQISTFFSGLALAWIYLARRDGAGRAFTVTALVHAVANLLFWAMLHTLPEGWERRLGAEDAVLSVVVCGAVAWVLSRPRPAPPSVRS